MQTKEKRKNDYYQIWKSNHAKIGDRALLPLEYTNTPQYARQCTMLSTIETLTVKWTRVFLFWIFKMEFFLTLFLFFNAHFFFEYFSTFSFADAKERRGQYIVFNGITSDFPNQFENGETMHLFGISLYLNKFFFLPISSSLQ